MKHHYVHDAWILLFLTIAIVLVSCGEDPKQEQERIKYAEIVDNRLEWKVWSHGPANKYLSMYAEMNEPVTKEQWISSLEMAFTMPLYTGMIDLGFEKLYFCTQDVKIEFRANKKRQCWEAK